MLIIDLKKIKWLRGLLHGEPSKAGAEPSVGPVAWVLEM